MSEHTIWIGPPGDQRPTGFNLVCSGYLVEAGKVLLVYHRGFDMWVPPGGHLEPGETFSAAAEREFREETGLSVRAISAQPNIHTSDPQAIPEPAPFYIDVEYDFQTPTIVQFFYVRRLDRAEPLKLQRSEVADMSWFEAEEVVDLPTFAQVRSVAAHALAHYPR